MPQPTPYNRTYDFEAERASGPGGVFPANLVDVEFNNVKRTLDETLANLELLQRDDGTLQGLDVGTIRATQAQAEAGENNEEYMTPLRASQHLAATLPAVPMSAEDAVVQRTLAEWTGADLINLVAMGADSTFTTANFFEAFDKAKTVAAGRSRACIFIPGGLFKGETAANITTNSSVNGLDVIGAGERATRIFPTGTGPWFQIGNQSGARTENIGFAHLSIAAGGAAPSSGAVFDIRNAKEIRFNRVGIQGGYRILSLGAGALAQNNVTDVHVSECTWQNNANAVGSGGNGIGMVLLVSGSILKITGLRATCAGAATTARLIEQLDTGGTNYNWDTVQMTNVVGEGFGRVVHIAGLGLAGLQITQSIVDVTQPAFYTNPLTAGESKFWKITNSQFGKGTSGTTTTSAMLVLSESNGGSVFGIRLAGNTGNNLTATAVDVGAGCGGVKIHGNEFNNCSPGLPLIAFAGSSGSVIGNDGLRTTGTPFTDTVLFTNGPLSPARKEVANTIDGGSGAAVSGPV